MTIIRIQSRSQIRKEPDQDCDSVPRCPRRPCRIFPSSDGRLMNSKDPQRPQICRNRQTDTGSSSFSPLSDRGGWVPESRRLLAGAGSDLRHQPSQVRRRCSRPHRHTYVALSSSKSSPVSSKPLKETGRDPGSDLPEERCYASDDLPSPPRPDIPRITATSEEGEGVKLMGQKRDHGLASLRRSRLLQGR